MARNILLLRLGLWAVFELAIVVFAVIAAWRNKRTGIWFLAVAVILAVFDDVLHMAWSNDFLARREDTTVYLVVLGYGYYAVILTALCGWVILAFNRKKGEKPDA